MYKKLLSIITIIAMLIVTNAYASDPLLLTDTEMQKLKAYFPDSDTANHQIWDGTPISIALPLNQEKRIIFPCHVTADLKSALTTDQLRIINNDKSLYLTAQKPFSTTRLYVTLQDTNEVVLIDISTDSNASHDETYIDIEQNNGIASKETTNSTNISNVNPPVPLESDTYATLMRFAWQQLFAPTRLLNNPFNIMRAPMHTSNLVSNLIYGDKVIAHPMTSWEYNNTFITSIELRNKYPITTQINVNSDLCGNWLAASLYPRKVLTSNNIKTIDNSDSTILLLISNKPFGDSMEVCKAYA